MQRSTVKKRIRNLTIAGVIAAGALGLTAPTVFADSATPAGVVKQYYPMNEPSLSMQVMYDASSLCQDHGYTYSEVADIQRNSIDPNKPQDDSFAVTVGCWNQ